MNFKVFAAFFIGLLSVNLSVQSPTLKEDTIKTVIIRVLEEIITVSTELLNNATALVDQAEKNKDQIDQDIVAWAVGVGINVNTAILGAIDGLKDGATDDGKAVIDCVDAEQAKTEAAITKIFGDIGTCAAGEGPLVLAEVRVILGQLGDLRDDVQGQSTTLGACTDDDATCLVDFALTLVATAQKIPDKVVEDVNAIIALIRTIASDVQGCAGDIGKEIQSDIQDIFNETVVCIKK